ncbi:hypothetical protein WJX82_011497 [Trebouxia sp. C0006]
MVDVQNRLTDLREEAYAKVLRCLPYPRQWATELLITGLRNEFGIVDDVHEEILEAVMTNTERPRKKHKSSHNQPHAYEQSSPKHRKLGYQSDQFDAEQPFARAGSGALPSGSARGTVADKVELAKQKIKAQGSANMGPSSRLAAAVAGPIKAKKRKERLEPSISHAAPAYEPPQPTHQQMRQLTEDEIAQGCKLDPYIGMRVKRLWPEDGGWFEGVVTDYSAVNKQHCITYKFNTDDESFEWYDLRNRNQDECKILKGKVDVLAKVAQHQQPAHPNGLPVNGSKPPRKPGQGFGRGSKKGPGRHSALGGRGGHSQRVAPYQPPSSISHQPPTAHKFQVVSSDDDDYGAGGSDEDVSDDGDYGL